MTRNYDTNSGNIADWMPLLTELAIMLAPKAYALIKQGLSGKSDPYLNYDIDYLLASYSDETPIFGSVPYSEVVDLLVQQEHALGIDVIRRPFRLKRGRRGEIWRIISDTGFEALADSERISKKRNDSVVRLTAITHIDDAPTLIVQKATYHDQARSNLILDYVALADNPTVTLRMELTKKHGKRLPPLSETRLANNVGVACQLFYREGGQYVPYLVKRVSKVGVMPGGIHCSASGAAAWPSKTTLDFDGYFTTDMCREIEEEIGCKKTDIEDMRPVALCREFLRAGKPQVFFAGITSLSRDELRERRTHASKVVEITKNWPEVERDRWYKSADVIIPTEAITQNVSKLGMTIEGIAALHYGIRYLATRITS